MFCQTCPQKAFCSHLCPEAEAYVSQDHQTAREFLSFPEAKYIARPEPRQKFASLSKTEWKILALPKKGFTHRTSTDITFFLDSRSLFQYTFQTAFSTGPTIGCSPQGRYLWLAYCYFID